MKWRQEEGLIFHQRVHRVRKDNPRRKNNGICKLVIQVDEELNSLR